ncbi:MAG: hypothetical protein A4E54_01878 [Pelotomaculum sp. PtaB.Bin117]|nr:MAG: hypothetical protein A4E54_01878 [Pelotomaculum sp. PtaB.Bin117]OPY58723.1 MAG: hypothetical protein A4E56_03347 [Pelotomaculum sp. PtaU1.Bin065]
MIKVEITPDARKYILQKTDTITIIIRTTGS